MCLYVDDSGTRNPDRKVPLQFMFRDWFTLGGYLSREEDEGAIRTAHSNFCDIWGIPYPLHSYDIRAETGNFTWLGALDQKEKNRFFSGLNRLHALGGGDGSKAGQGTLKRQEAPRAYPGCLARCSARTASFS